MYPSLGSVFPFVFLIIICFPLLLSLSPQLLINFFHDSQLSRCVRTEARALYGLSQARFSFHLNHLPHQPTGVGTWGRQCMVLLWAWAKPSPPGSCQLPPLCQVCRRTVCRRTEVRGAWLPSQTPLLRNSSGQTQQVCMSLEEWLIIYLGLPSSLTVENLICLSIAQIHYVVEKNVKILFSKFSLCLRWMSLWDFSLTQKNKTELFCLFFEWRHFKLKHN